MKDEKNSNQVQPTKYQDFQILNVNENQPEDKIKEPKWGVRHLQAVLLFLLIGASTSIRTSLNIAVLAMSSESNSSNVQIYDWNKDTHGFILSSTGWGNTVIQLVAGILINRYGGKIFITSSVTLTALLMLIVPWSASMGDWIGVCVVMSLQGLCQGFMFPATHALLGRWAPVNERTRLGMFVYSGMYLGLILTPPIAASIGSSSYGWPWIFYFFGAQTLASCVLWMIYGSDSPSNCKRISRQEKAFIEESLNSADSKLSADIPWKSILTSVPFYALLCAQIGGTWGFMTIYNETPSYLALGLNIGLKNSGLLTSLGFVNGLFFTIIASWIADYLLNKNYLSITSVRKLCNTIGCWSPALMFLTLAFLSREQETFMVIALIMVAGLDGISSCGFMVNHIDLSPRYAGILVGIGSSISDAVCLLEPIIAGQLVGEDSSNLDNWKYIFVIAAGMYFFGNIAFLLFGSGDTQPWNDSLVIKDSDKKKQILSTELLVKYKRKTSEN